MFSLGDQKQSSNPAVLLEGEEGTFRVVSPSGDVSRYECQAGHSIASIEHLGTTEPRQQWLIEKIGDHAAPSQVNVTPRRKTGQNA
jgi:hypothetical protein